MERTLVRVDVGACRCPGSPHPSDWVDLSPDMTIDLGSAAYAAIRQSQGDDVRLQGLLAQAYVQFGIRAWSFTDGDGDPIRVVRGDKDYPDLIDELLPWSRGGSTVSERADELYSEEVLRPFRKTPSTPSQDGPTGDSTSPILPTGERPPTPAEWPLQSDTDGSPSSE